MNATANALSLCFDVVAEWTTATHTDGGTQCGAEAQAIFTTLEASFAQTPKELGETTLAAASLGIEKP